jgi:hypothetical protein
LAWKRLCGGAANSHFLQAADPTPLRVREEPDKESRRHNGKFLQRLAQFAEETDPMSPLFAFLNSFASDDEFGMRQAIRMLHD